MAFYMLDTNAVSAVMRGNPLMDERLLQLDPADWCISAVTHSEICYGLSLRPEATTLIRAADAFLAVATTLAWDATAAAAHGRLRAQLRHRVGSGSSSRALERALSRIKLTFTWQGSLCPQQPISVAVPQQSISVAASNRKWWRV